MTVSYLMHKVGKLSYPDEDMKLVLVWDPFATNNNAQHLKRSKVPYCPPHKNLESQMAENRVMGVESLCHLPPTRLA